MKNYREFPVVWSDGSGALMAFIHERLDRSSLSKDGKRYLAQVLMENISQPLAEAPTVDVIVRDSQKALKTAGSLLVRIGFYPDSIPHNQQTHYVDRCSSLHERAARMFGIPFLYEISNNVPKAARAITEIRIEHEYRTIIRSHDLDSEIPLRADPAVQRLLKRALQEDRLATEVLDRIGIYKGTYFPGPSRMQ